MPQKAILPPARRAPIARCPGRPSLLPPRVQPGWQLWGARASGAQGQSEGQSSQSPCSGRGPASVSPKGAMIWLSGQSLRPTQLPVLAQPLQQAVGLCQPVHPLCPDEDPTKFLSQAHSFLSLSCPFSSGHPHLAPCPGRSVARGPFPGLPSDPGGCCQPASAGCWGISSSAHSPIITPGQDVPAWVPSKKLSGEGPKATPHICTLGQQGLPDSLQGRNQWPVGWGEVQTQGSPPPTCASPSGLLGPAPLFHFRKCFY